MFKEVNLAVNKVKIPSFWMKKMFGIHHKENFLMNVVYIIICVKFVFIPKFKIIFPLYYNSQSFRNILLKFQKLINFINNYIQKYCMHRNIFTSVAVFCVVPFYIPKRELNGRHIYSF